MQRVDGDLLCCELYCLLRWRARSQHQVLCLICFYRLFPVRIEHNTLVKREDLYKN
jgi:hypothetical protein